MNEGESPENGSVLITGGAGFIGTNLAHALLSSGRNVIICDNLSRPGTEKNLEWLKSVHNDLEFVHGDVRDITLMRELVPRVSEVYHFAAQVAVTTSLVDPLHDFSVNLQGTLSLLEAVRSRKNPPFLLFTSTNKVYGNLPDLEFRDTGSRWEPVDGHIRHRGIDETRRLDFHSPYGCSKGASDQYVLDYARSYGIPAVVFRMSCIYGTHQFGTEDQGWVAHFLIRALAGEKIMIYGDGRQVRDVLFADDLVRAFLAARKNPDRTVGKAFNIGGTVRNTVSLRELLELIGELTGKRPETGYAAWRQGDQKYYVSDTSAFESATGWKPEVTVREGVEKLIGWLRESVVKPERHPEKERA